MERRIKLVLSITCLTTLLVACGGGSKESSNVPNSLSSLNSIAASSFVSSNAGSSSKESSVSSSASSTASSASSSTSSIASNSVPNSSSIIKDSTSKAPTKRISLKMFGSLHVNSIRTIYAIKQNMTDEIEWSSSNPEVIRTSARDGLDTECSLIVLKVGTATIKAQSKTDNSVYVEKTFTIEKGTTMPENLYKTLTSSLEVNGEVSYLNYDKDYDSTVADKDYTRTIFEESNPESTEDPNYTDAYQLTIKDKNNNTTYETKFLRGAGGYVSTEDVNYKNEIVTKKVLTEDHPDGIKFNSSYYINFFAQSDYISYKDFETFDNGATYTYVGSFLSPTYLCASLLLTDLSPDQLYLKVENNGVSRMIFDIDPYNKDVKATEKYGMHAELTFDKKGTAKIDHMAPLEHKAFHDDLQQAVNANKMRKNYKVVYSLDVPNSEDEVVYTLIFSEDTIDTKITNHGVITYHKGIHKYKEGYIEYNYNDESETVTIDQFHDSAWDKVNRYPTFDFAVELFNFENGKYYIPKGRTNEFMRTCFYMPQLLDLSSFYDSEITLTEDKQIATIKSKFKNDYELNGTFDAIFSDYGTADVGIDFSKLTESEGPKSFSEANDYLYNEMGHWEIQDVVPYLYSKPGWSNSIGWLRNNTDPEKHGVEYIFIETKKFETETERDEFISSYKTLLVSLGYEYSETKLLKDLPTYTKGNYTFAIDTTRFWNGNADMAVRIYIESPNFNINMYYDYN